jgi:hypothetical protein
MKKLLKASSTLAIIAGAVLIAGGVWAIGFTCENVAREKIVTPADSAIPGIEVRGPLSLKVQADIIREHTLKMTGGKTYAEMSREDPARETWVTATSLTTALNLGIITYVFSGLIVLLGLISVWTGAVFWALAKRF